MKTGMYNLKLGVCLSCTALITLGVALAPGHAQATDRLVGPPFFESGNPKLPDDCTKIACSFAQAIKVADRGDHVVIQSGPVIAHDVIINKDLTIESGSCPIRVRIDAQSIGRHFDIATAQPATVTLQCLDLVNGVAAEGGAIRVGSQGALILKNSKIIAASATQDGGAILNSGGTISVLDSELIDNHSNGNGGAIAAEGGTVTVRRSQVQGNEGVNGGAIAGNRTPVVVTASTLSGNHARGGDGGAVMARSGSVLIGAASVLEANTATGHRGGAVHSELSSLTIQVESTLRGNSAAMGGAIAAAGGNVTITDASLEANSASASGGALFLAMVETGISLSDFTDNTAEEDGGAILRTDAGSLTIAESAFESNSARRGGAVADAPGQSGTTTIIDRSGFTHNEAAGNGGAIDRIGDGGLLHVVNSTFSGNSAAADGGALFNDPNGDLSIVYSTFVGNQANGSPNLAGGGFTSLGGARLLHSILSGNTPRDCASAPALLIGTGNLAGDCRSDLVLGTDFNRGDVTHLGPLGGLIGKRPIHELLSGSNAIDLGPTACRDPIVGARITQDQIGQDRAFDGDSDGVASCDVGAIEFTRLSVPQGDLDVGLGNR